MRRKRRIEITVFAEQTVVIRPVNLPQPGWCESCAANAPLLTPERAAVIAGVTVRSIFQRVEAGQLHFVEPLDGRLLICANSLAEKSA
jgi:hypothetical protein